MLFCLLIYNILKLVLILFSLNPNIENSTLLETIL